MRAARQDDRPLTAKPRVCIVVFTPCVGAPLASLSLGRPTIRRTACIFSALLIAAVPSVADAQSSATDLTGDWVMEAGEVGHWGGDLRAFDERDAVVLVIDEQLGGVFRGTIIYENNPDGPEFEGRIGIGHVLPEPVLGVVDWDDRTVFWVDHDDQTIHRGRLVDENRMEVVALEPGEFAVVNRMILVRR